MKVGYSNQPLTPWEYRVLMVLGAFGMVASLAAAASLIVAVGYVIARNV